MRRVAGDAADPGPDPWDEVQGNAALQFLLGMPLGPLKKPSFARRPSLVRFHQRFSFGGKQRKKRERICESQTRGPRPRTAILFHDCAGRPQRRTDTRVRQRATRDFGKCRACALSTLARLHRGSTYLYVCSVNTGGRFAKRKHKKL